ncbi:MAG: LEA type 2 family protein [Deferrisomatales bacterium]
MRGLRCRMVLAGLLTLAAGCAALRPGGTEPPRLTLSDLRVTGATLFSQTYRLRLAVQNPNPFPLEVDGMAYELRVNDQPFASGVSDLRVSLPRYGSRTVEVDALGTVTGLLRQLSALEKARAQQGFRYRLTGHLSLAGTARRLPFDYQGEISLGPQATSP